MGLQNFRNLREIDNYKFATVDLVTKYLFYTVVKETVVFCRTEEHFSNRWFFLSDGGRAVGCSSAYTAYKAKEVLANAQRSTNEEK
jgi:hypothetical protein